MGSVQTHGVHGAYKRSKLFREATDTATDISVGLPLASVVTKLRAVPRPTGTLGLYVVDILSSFLSQATSNGQATINTATKQRLAGNKEGNKAVHSERGKRPCWLHIVSM